MINGKWIVVALIILLVLLQAYRYSPYKLEFLGYYNSKIGAHKCNSLSKLNSATKYFNRVELDLVYDAALDKLDIHHPPEESPSGLYLEDYIKEVATYEKPIFMWLDVKNLYADNAILIYNRIHSVLKKYSIPKEKVLIETRYPEALPIFLENGFLSSYYITSRVENLKGADLKAALHSIKVILEKHPKMAISFSYEKYEVLSEAFPAVKKYIWQLVRVVNLQGLQARKILNDDTVEVLLINYKPI